MSIPLIVGLVGLLTCAYIWMGNRAAKKLEQTDDYYLMGRGLTLIPLTLTLLATQLGGGTLIGACQEAYSKGWVVLFYPLGASLGFLALSLGLGKKYREQNVTTVAEIFEKAYQAKSLRWVASGLSVVSSFLILTGQGVALIVFSRELGVDSPFITIGLWSVLVFYTVMGGLRAVVNTDVLQALFILAVLSVTFFVADGSVAESQPLNFEGVPWTGWFLLPLLFTVIGQDMGQRCFAAKNGRVVTIASIFAACLLMLSSSFAVYFGVLARGIDIGEGSCVLVSAVEALTNPYITSFFIVTIILAITSSADSLLCSLSSNLSCDFFKGKSLTASKCITPVMGIASLCLAYFSTSVVSVLMFSYELSVSVLFVPILMALYQKRPSKWGAIAAMSVGAAGIFLFPAPSEVYTLISSFMGYYAGAFLERRRVVQWIKP